jgi:hypothetical protein
MANAQPFKTLLKKLSGSIQSAVKEVKASTDPIIAEIELPLFSAWLVNKTKDPLRIIEEAFAIREKEPFLRARRHLTELGALAFSSNVPNFVRETNKLVAAIQNMSNDFRTIYGIKTGNGISASPLIFAYNLIANTQGLLTIPNLPIKIPTPNKLLEIKNRKGFNGVFHSVAHDLVAIERLGSAHELLTSKIKFKPDQYKDTAPTYVMKVEEKRFFGRSSHWKKPM